MDPADIKYLVHNPSSLKHMCVRSIRQSISCMEQNVELNLIEKLTAGKLDDLKNPSVPILLENMCKYVHNCDTKLFNTLM